jgi:hypothetical protein
MLPLNKFAPITVFVLTTMGFAYSANDGNREGGYVPVVITTTGTTGGTGGTATTASTRNEILPERNCTDTANDGPIYVLRPGFWYGFQVRYGKKYDSSAESTPLKPMRVYWTATLYDSTTQQRVTGVDVRTLIHFHHPQDDDSASDKEKGRVCLQDVSPYSTSNRYFVQLQANCDYTNGNSTDSSPAHNSVRLYWLSPDPENYVRIPGILRAAENPGAFKRGPNGRLRPVGPGVRKPGPRRRKKQPGG